MPITVIVPSADGTETRLTFDGMQRIVIGRGASCDVRLPDASVSHRHACLRPKGADFLLTDEGSTNGTFVGQVRIASRTTRIVRSGDAVRVGRIWLGLRIEQRPATRDVAATTRDLALALVAEALAAAGNDLTVRLRVVEGADLGATLALKNEGHAYVVGRAAQCDLPLSDGDASREHVSIVRRGGVVFVCDLATKNGTWLGDARAPPHHDVAWRPTHMMQIGSAVLALEEPVRDALARIENAPDESLSAGDPVAPPPRSISSPEGTGASDQHNASGGHSDSPSAAPMERVTSHANSWRQERARFSIADVAVMATAIGVLAASIAGLLWLLRG